ncbi:MAG: alpha/beta hydrolase [Bacteroidetes bacterium]|jgi:proline iminopeptidase|nr:alpha/beta hydrolase [Bacteroidota bacterium]
MKNILTLIIAFVISSAPAQTLYSKAFGDKKNKALIFLHGGPGYNCANFEVTSAQKLADAGYYVIVYDRRGEGRSTDAKAKFTFEETFTDLNAVYKQYGLQQAGLIGHSFGGIVATLYAEKFPQQVSAVILVGAPVALQETFLTIRESSKKLYLAKNDTMNLMYLGMIEKMDPKSIPYASYCFGHAMQNGFYSPKNRSEEATALYKTLATDSMGKYAGQMTYQAPQGFWTNEHYTSLDLTAAIKNLLVKKMNIFGLYGKDDGLYSAKQVQDLQSLIGADKVKYLDDCSHNVFIDQQTQFIGALKNRIK